MSRIQLLTVQTMDKSAKYFTIGRTLGLVDGNDVQAWVDEQIAASVEPSDVFLDLAFIARSNIKELLSKLSYIEDNTDDFKAIRMLIAEIGAAQLTDINFCSRLATHLYDFYVLKNKGHPGVAP